MRVKFVRVITQVRIRQLLDAGHPVAGLRADTVRAQPVVPSHALRVRHHAACRRLGNYFVDFLIVIGTCHMPGKFTHIYNLETNCISHRLDLTKTFVTW